LLSCNPDPYERVWSDEFSVNGLPDTTKWIFQTGGHGWGNRELQYYCEGTSNAEVKDGLLIITARKDSFGNNAYTSARLNSKRPEGSWKYGKIEARMKIPYAKGIWPAFWMMGVNFDTVSWPFCGEIDIMESIGPKEKPGMVHGTAHWANPANQWTSRGDTVTVTETAETQGFHVYSVIWDKDSISWFADDRQYFALSIETEEFAAFHKPFYILLNLAVGGNWPGYPDETTSFPQQLFIDYVRVYQAREQ
jgi:beta-glucanase (GH16 family)